MTSSMLRKAVKGRAALPLFLVGGAAAMTMMLVKRWRRRQGAAESAVSQSAFDQARPGGPPRSPGMGEARSDRELFDKVSAPEGYGPAPGGYGPASAPAGAHGGSGIFGAEGAGGGPGNEPQS